MSEDLLNHTRGLGKALVVRAAQEERLELERRDLRRQLCIEIFESKSANRLTVSGSDGEGRTELLAERSAVRGNHERSEQIKASISY